jgi:mannose-6-phosphate isomerase-like protein (cupin superfamily)
MDKPTVRLHRWDEIALDKVTEMISRKIVTGEREMLAQIYLKRGALVPMHSHESEQMTYILQGALKFLINGEEIFSPIRHDWLDGTDTYFQEKTKVD